MLNTINNILANSNYKGLLVVGVGLLILSGIIKTVKKVSIIILVIGLVVIGTGFYSESIKAHNIVHGVKSKTSEVIKYDYKGKIESYKNK